MRGAPPAASGAWTSAPDRWRRQGSPASSRGASTTGAPASPVAPDVDRAGEGIGATARPADGRGTEEAFEVAARAYHRADSRAVARSTAGGGGWRGATGGSEGPLGGRVASAGAAASSFRWRRWEARGLRVPEARPGAAMLCRCPARARTVPNNGSESALERGAPEGLPERVAEPLAGGGQAATGRETCGAEAVTPVCDAARRPKRGFLFSRG